MFYTHTLEDSTEYVVSPIGGAGLPGNYVYLQPRFSMLDEQTAIFGELSWKMTDYLKLTAGLRYSDLKYNGVVQEIEQGAFGALNVDTPSSGESRPVTPRVVLNYTPDSDSLYYVSASKGFRPGGINTTLPTTCLPTGLDQKSAAAPFSSDSLWQYEIGSKNTLFDHHLTVSGSLYYIQWKNIQQFVYLSCGLGFDYNLGQVTGKGGDLEIDWKPYTGTTLGLTAAYTDSKFNNNVTLPGGTDQLVASGDHLPASPWNIDANLEYVWTAFEKKPYVRFRLPVRDRAELADSVPGRGQQSELRPHAAGPAHDPHPQRARRRAVQRIGPVAVRNQRAQLPRPIFASRDFAAEVFGLPHDLDNNYFGRGYAPRTVGVTATYKF